MSMQTNSSLQPLVEGPSTRSPVRVAYITSMRELESEGVGSFISSERDTLSTLLSYRRDGVAPQPGDPVSHHWDHLAGQTYEVALIITDDDIYNPLTSQSPDPTPHTRARLIASGLPHVQIPSSAWSSIKNDAAAKTQAKAEYEQKILDVLAEHNIDIILSDSYTRLFGPVALAAMGGRILNIHPAYTKDLPGITPTSDGAFRHGLYRRVHSGENFISVDGERCYRIPLRYEHLFAAHDLAEVLRGFHARRIFFPAEVYTQLAGTSLEQPLVVSDKKGSQYQIVQAHGQINVLEHEVSRVRELFVNRFADTSVEQDSQGGYWLLTPVRGERGRFSAKTGATFHEIDAGIDTGRVLHFTRSTPIRNENSRSTARMIGQPRSPVIDSAPSSGRRDGIQLLRESNYETKNNVLKIGILTQLRTQQMQDRIVRGRETAVMNARPAALKLS